MRSKFSLVHIQTGLSKIVLTCALAALGSNGRAAISLGEASPHVLLQLSDVPLSQAATDARNASSAAAALPADFSPGNLTSGQTIHLNTLTPKTPGVYVINTTSFTLTGGGALIIDGTGIAAGSQVIINDSGQFTLHGNSSIQVSGGLTVNQLLINDTGTQGASITGNSQLFGSFLGPNLSAHFSSNFGAVNGQVIADSIKLDSHFSVLGELFVPEPSTIIAATLLLIPLAISALRVVRKRSTLLLRFRRKSC
jgi:choice-of-anchor A domain-containing protein